MAQGQPPKSRKFGQLSAKRKRSSFDWGDDEYLPGVATRSTNSSGQAGRSRDPESYEQDEQDDRDRHRTSTPFTYTVTGSIPVAYVEICDENCQITRISVPPGSTWKITAISLS